MAEASLTCCQDENQHIARYRREIDHSINEYAHQLREAQELCASAMEPHRHRIEVSSSKIRDAEAVLRRAKDKQSSKKLPDVTRHHDQGDLDMVRLIIVEQKFNGLWDIGVDFIKELTSKTLSDFQGVTNAQMLITAIIIVILETRFASLSSMWYGVVQKARKCLLDLLDKDAIKLDILFEDIRKQL